MDCKIEKLRNQIGESINYVKNELEPSRHSSIVITKLEEAQMRAGCLFSKGKTDGIIKR